MTTAQWWKRVKANPELLTDWLRKQYHGEITAHDRIQEFARTLLPEGSKWGLVLQTIAGQELTHAQWVGELLEARGITAEVLSKEERYWNQTLPQIDSFESGAAVAAHAEQMRLERIREIAADATADADIRTVFQRIIPEEVFHAKAFAAMAGDEAMAAALFQHKLGMEAIGLIPPGM